MSVVSRFRTLNPVAAAMVAVIILSGFIVRIADALGRRDPVGLIIGATEPCVGARAAVTG